MKSTPHTFASFKGLPCSVKVPGGFLFLSCSKRPWTCRPQKDLQQISLPFLTVSFGKAYIMPQENNVLFPKVSSRESLITLQNERENHLLKRCSFYPHRHTQGPLIWMKKMKQAIRRGRKLIWETSRKLIERKLLVDTYVSFHLYDPSNLLNPLPRTHKLNSSTQPVKLGRCDHKILMLKY